MELFRFGVKVAATGLEQVAPEALINTFHRWIQDGVLEDLLLDVADYSHVFQGPGVMLVAHEGNYSVDDSGGRRGLAYYSKREMEGDLEARLARVCRRAFRACSLLEEPGALGPSVSFRASELEFFSNDRLLAPNTDGTLEAMQPAMATVLGRLFAGSGWKLAREPDPAERFRVSIRADNALGAGEALARLA